VTFGAALAPCGRVKRREKWTAGVDIRTLASPSSFTWSASYGLLCDVD
jgi:hypothetical protein